MTLTDKENESRTLLKELKPLVYDKCLEFDNQLAKGKSIALIQLQYKYLCNFHCSHCSIVGFRNQEHDRQLDIPTVKRVFEEAHEYGLAHMGISGGEPLVFKDLEQLIEAINPSRFHIQLDTNGWLFTSAVAKRMKSLGVDKVQISIDGLDAHEHDTFRKKIGSHEKCLEAIEHAKEAGLALQVATVVGHERAKSDEFYDFMRLMHDKCAPVSVIYAKPVGEYAKRLDLMCTADDIAHVKKLLHLYGGYDHTTPGYGQDLGCTAVKRVISITAFGEVLPCPWMYWTLGNIFDTSLDAILTKGMSYFGERYPVCRLSESPEFNEKYTSKTYGCENLLTVEEVMD
jgi:MoaA/NifB/PqqE/SkfB family radical SAM enzyme